MMFALEPQKSKTRISQHLESCHISITCIVDSVPHLVTVDAPGLVGVVVLKDSLKQRESPFEFVGCHPAGTEFMFQEWQLHSYLPLFDLIPQMSELLQIESTCPVHLSTDS